MLGDEVFFDLLSRFQSNRMDDQRCSIQDKGSRVSLNSDPEPPPRAIRKCESIHQIIQILLWNFFTLKGNASSSSVSSLNPSPSSAVSESGNITDGQGRRLEEPSAAGGGLPGLRLHQNSNQAVLNHLMANADNAEPDDDFFNMLVKCQVLGGTR